MGRGRRKNPRVQWTRAKDYKGGEVHTATVNGHTVEVRKSPGYSSLGIYIDGLFYCTEPNGLVWAKTAGIESAEARTPRRSRTRNPMPTLGGAGPFPEGCIVEWPGPEMSRMVRAAVMAYDGASTHAQLHRAHTRALNKAREWERKAGRRLPSEWFNTINFSYTDALKRLGPSAEDIRDAAMKAHRERDKTSRRRIRKNPRKNPTMRAVYFPMNAAWGVLFGDSIIDIDAQRFWPSKKGLVWALRGKGLKLDRQNKIKVDRAA